MVGPLGRFCLRPTCLPSRNIADCYHSLLSWNIAWAYQMCRMNLSCQLKKSNLQETTSLYTKQHLMQTTLQSILKAKRADHCIAFDFIITGQSWDITWRGRQGGDDWSRFLYFIRVMSQGLADEVVLFEFVLVVGGVFRRGLCLTPFAPLWPFWGLWVALWGDVYHIGGGGWADAGGDPRNNTRWRWGRQAKNTYYVLFLNDLKIKQNFRNNSLV